MPASQTQWTADMARALPDDGKRYEVLDGELFVTPSPSTPHQRALRELYDRLHAYVKAQDVGEPFWSPSDIEFSPRRLLQPDLFIVPARAEGRIRKWSDVRGLLLAIEVLSPSTARADRHRKRVIYQSERVPEYWIVDLEARLIERWRPNDDRPEIVTDSLVWAPASGLEGLAVDLQRFFAEVLD